MTLPAPARAKGSTWAATAVSRAMDGAKWAPNKLVTGSFRDYYAKMSKISSVLLQLCFLLLVNDASPISDARLAQVRRNNPEPPFSRQKPTNCSRNYFSAITAGKRNLVRFAGRCNDLLLFSVSFLDFVLFEKKSLTKLSRSSRGVTAKLRSVTLGVCVYVCKKSWLSSRIGFE